jgi:hypothetical protein
LSNSPETPLKLKLWLQDYWASSLATLGPLILAISNIWQMVDAGKWKPTFGTVTVIGIVMSLIGGIGQMLLTPGNKTLQILL